MLSVDLRLGSYTSRDASLVKTADMQAWEDGKFIQDAMPYLTAGERELLISATCGDCFDKFFPIP